MKLTRNERTMKVLRKLHPEFYSLRIAGRMHRHSNSKGSIAGRPSNKIELEEDIDELEKFIESKVLAGVSWRRW